MVWLDVWNSVVGPGVLAYDCAAGWWRHDGCDGILVSRWLDK